MMFNRFLVLVALFALVACTSCRPPKQLDPIKQAPDSATRESKKDSFITSLSNDVLTDPDLYEEQLLELSELTSTNHLDHRDLIPFATNRKEDRQAAALMWCCNAFLFAQVQALATGEPLERNIELEKVLLNAFESEDGQVKYQAAIGLAGIFGDTDAEEYAVHEYLHLENEELDYLYWRQVTALGPGVPRIVAKELVNGYEDVCLAFRLISRFQGDTSVEILSSYIPTIDSAGIDCLAEAIAMLGDPRFAKPLISRFRKDAASWDEPTRRWVITALGYCRHEAALPILTDHLQSGHPVTRDAAAAGLRRIKPVTDGELLAPYLLGVGDYTAYVEKIADPLKGLVEEMKSNPFLPADRQARLLGTIEELLADAPEADREAALNGLEEVEQGVLTRNAQDILTRILGG